MELTQCRGMAFMKENENPEEAATGDMEKPKPSKNPLKHWGPSIYGIQWESLYLKS